jgi:hypothetical protein
VLLRRHQQKKADARYDPFIDAQAAFAILFAVVLIVVVLLLVLKRLWDRAPPLPWLPHKFGEAVQKTIAGRGQILLEKK